MLLSTLQLNLGSNAVISWLQIGAPISSARVAFLQLDAPVPPPSARVAFLQLSGNPPLPAVPSPTNVSVAATGATTAAAALTDPGGGVAEHRWQIQQVGGGGAWTHAAVVGGNPSAPGVTSVTLTGLPAAGEFLLRVSAETFGGLAVSPFAYAPASFWTDNPGTGGADIPSGGPAQVAVAGVLTHVVTAAVQAAVSTSVQAAVAGSVAHTLAASAQVDVAFSVPPAQAIVAGAITHSLVASVRADVTESTLGATRAPPGRRITVGAADVRSGALADRFYPFDLQDQLDFEWEFEFDAEDGDSVSYCTFAPAPGLVSVASYVNANRATCWVAVDEAAPPSEFDLLPVTCHMFSASTPPRKADATVYLQIRVR